MEGEKGRGEEKERGCDTLEMSRGEEKWREEGEEGGEKGEKGMGRERWIQKNARGWREENGERMV